MFHVKFKHIQHLKGNRSESMHWTFSKGWLNLRKLTHTFFHSLVSFETCQTLRSLRNELGILPAEPHTKGSLLETPILIVLKDQFPFQA